MSKHIPVPKSGPFACEDVSRPVVVREKDGVTTRELPCIYRCKGLVVHDSTPLMGGSNWAARKENGWETDSAWGVTHEISGASLCIWEYRHEAVAALQVLLATDIDWTQDTDSVRRAVQASPLAASAVLAMREGRLVVSFVHAQKPGVA